MLDLGLGNVISEHKPNTTRLVVEVQIVEGGATRTLEQRAVACRGTSSGGESDQNGSHAKRL